MADIKDNRPLCEVLKGKITKVPSVVLYKIVDKKETLTDNWLEAVRFKFIEQKQDGQEE